MACWVRTTLALTTLAAGCDRAFVVAPAAPELDVVTLTGGAMIDGPAPIRLTVGGQLGDEALSPGTLVYLYEHVGERGYFVVAADAGAFTFEEIALDLDHNCVQVYSEAPGAEAASSDNFYVLSITGDSPRIDAVLQQDGACVSSSGDA